MQRDRLGRNPAVLAYKYEHMFDKCGAGVPACLVMEKGIMIFPFNDYNFL